MILSDADFALRQSIPDVTDKTDTIQLYEHGGDQFLNEMYKGDTWRRAWDHCDYLNEKHYEDHISFCVVKYCQDFYVLDKHEARKLKLIP